MKRVLLVLGVILVALIVLGLSCKKDKPDKEGVVEGIVVPQEPASLMGASLVKPVTIIVRFGNACYCPTTNIFKVDALFKADTIGQQLFGMNVRFWFDSTILKFKQFTEFQGGYYASSPNPPYVATGSMVTGTWFGFKGAATFVNGAVELGGKDKPIVLDNWSKLFSIEFEVKNPINTLFCPPLVWDLEYDPAGGGFLPGCGGVVMIIVTPTGSYYCNEGVEQFNWLYSKSIVSPYGAPVSSECVQ